jgi:hypothetical protein
MLRSLPYVRSDCNDTFVIKPLYGCGIGSFLVNTFSGYAMQALYKSPHYYNESGYHIFGRQGMFWKTYFLDVGFEFPLEEETQIQAAVNVFDPAQRTCFINKMSGRGLRSNIDFFRTQMKKFWRLNRNTHQYILEEVAKFPVNTPYTSVVLRGGDKVTLEAHLKMPGAEVLANEVLKTGVINVHIISDSYHLVNHFKGLLPSNTTFFTTCTSHSSGFFLSELQTWSDDVIKQEVLTTLLNYELARRAKEVITTENTNIGIWINLLRLMDQTRYSFVENSPNFPYFGPSMIPPRNDSASLPPPY